MKDRAFSIHFEMRNNYLYVHLSGQDSFDASLDYWNRIIRKAQQLGISRVLVHESLEGSVSEGEMFNIMEDIVPQGAGIQVAFFDEKLSDAEVNDFGELIARNRGADIQVFESKS